MPLFTMILAAAFLRGWPATPAQALRIPVGMPGVGPQLPADGLMAAGWGTAETLRPPLAFAGLALVAAAALRMPGRACRGRAP